jgi:uncharacterized protein (UPF0332 family)
VVNAAPWRWRIDKAGRMMRASQLARDAGDWETAISRAYYAIYHLAVSLLESKGGMTARGRWDHDQVHTAFGSQFANRGYIFNSRDATLLRELYQDRLVADYERTSVSQAQSQRRLTTTQSLYERILGAISDA